MVFFNQQRLDILDFYDQIIKTTKHHIKMMVYSKIQI